MTIADMIFMGDVFMFTKKIYCTDTKETVYNYNDYLKTKHWEKKRKYVARKKKHTCEKCGLVVQKGFHIHHLTYARLGNESPNDLLFLCKDCHSDLHKKNTNVFLDTIALLPSIKAKVEYTLKQKKDIKGLFEKHFNNFLEEVKEFDLQE